MFKFSCWYALSVCNAFFINEENERFEYTTRHPKDELFTTVEPERNFEEPIDFYKGFGLWHTPTRRKKNTTLSFEEFCVKYFPQFTSTPNWADYDTHAFTLPTNMSDGDILRAAMKHTVHSFEVEEYFREYARRTWFSEQDTYEKEEWRGWTTTAFYADGMVYNPNATWADVEGLKEEERELDRSLKKIDLDYHSDEYLKHLNEENNKQETLFTENHE